MLNPTPKRIDYAKTKSYATSRREDPLFVPPTAANASALLTQNAKRQRDGEDADGGRHAKREKPEEEDDEEMEIDDEDDAAAPNTGTSARTSHSLPSPC